MAISEFGSDFHYCIDLSSDKENILSKKEVIYSASGRQAIQHLIAHNKWERIWIPSYFCYQVVDAIKQTGIKIVFYDDFPWSNDEFLILKIDFEPKDVLLRVNYFGLRRWRDNANIPIPVIEDHSHDLFGEWTMNSNADWCIASLRKTLPIPEGGALWSPKGKCLPEINQSTIENELLTYKRFTAMLMKTLYLQGNRIPKNEFRTLFIETEENFDHLSVCSISPECIDILKFFDIKKWYELKHENWLSLSDLAHFNNNGIEILIPENIEECNPFSLVIKFKNFRQREIARRKLVQNNIYPAVLWDIPLSQKEDITLIGKRLLSIHCDGRYRKEQINQLKSTLLDIVFD